jgi:DNA-binding MarR family transcriptional regulator
MSATIVEVLNYFVYCGPMSRLTSQGTDLQRVVIRFVDAYIQDVSVAATSHGLTPSQAKLIALLDAPMPMRSIADRLFCDASNVTGLVDRLEARDLVRREASPLDRRVKLVLLTDAGKRLAKQIRSEQYGLHAALDGLDPASADRLGELLEQMIPALRDRGD